MQSNVIGGAGWTCWTLIVVMMLSLVCRVFAHHYYAYRKLFVRLCLCVCLFVRSFVYLFVLYIETHTH
jgi:Ca2+/H+ antiporter